MSTKKRRYLGIDGEGQGRYYHRYTLLACSNENGKRFWTLENRDGIGTVEALNFILSLPEEYSVFGYALHYDWTKILTDVDNRTLYFLFRPELRPPIKEESFRGPLPVHWNGFTLNCQASKFTISKIQGAKKIVIWDIFKFFQGKFVQALKDWKVGNDVLWKRMQLMKDNRSEFDRVEMAKIKAYCLEETQCMAKLAHKLVDAHEAVGLKLKSFYGAGSSAASILSLFNIKGALDYTVPKEMHTAIAVAFVGGRFENSVIGSIQDPVYSYDISSAYPYQIVFLPCLKHATWEFTTDRRQLNRARVALVQYGIRRRNPGKRSNGWAPLPFRESDGSICYPEESGGGWVYLAEYLAAERLFPGVSFRGAWIHRSECDCQPFKEVPQYYRERCRIGKEGPGIVLKLALNSIYGKLAQSIGNAPYNCWIWAGMITSGCRAQLLELMGLHKDMRNALMVATDGVCTLEKLSTPIPRDTGTFDVQVWNDKKKVHEYKPLGGWEEKIHERGMFFARPGVYFPLNPTKEEIKEIRARGIGKSIVLEQWKGIVESFHNLTQKPNYRDKLETYTTILTNVPRFCGAMSSIHRKPASIEQDAPMLYKRACGSVENGHPCYGEWVYRPVDMSFDPKPKRAGVARDGKRLLLRRLATNVESTPYHEAMKSEDGIKAAILNRQMNIELSEQPDCDFGSYQ